MITLIKVNKLKPNELQEVQNFKSHPTAIIIKEYKNWGFTVGDILIKKEKFADGSQVVVEVSPTCNVPKKYQVVHLDELGLPWIKQLSVRSGLGKRIYCLASFDTGRYTFCVDPMQLDCIILGAKYDPRREYRNMRDRNPSYGKHEDNETE